MTDTDKFTDSQIDYAVSFLNSLVAVDRQAVEHLIDSRVECNEAMCDTDVQVRVLSAPIDDPDEDEDSYWIGFLDVINGMFGVQRQGEPRPGFGRIG